jgi:hypothetical protein
LTNGPARFCGCLHRVDALSMTQRAPALIDRILHALIRRIGFLFDLAQGIL